MRHIYGRRASSDAHEADPGVTGFGYIGEVGQSEELDFFLDAADYGFVKPLEIPVTTAVPEGSTVILILFGHRFAAHIETEAEDSRGNSYQLKGFQTWNSIFPDQTGNGNRFVFMWGQINNALEPGDTITVTWIDSFLGLPPGQGFGLPTNVFQFAFAYTGTAENRGDIGAGDNGVDVANFNVCTPAATLTPGVPLTESEGYLMLSVIGIERSLQAGEDLLGVFDAWKTDDYETVEYFKTDTSFPFPISEVLIGHRIGRGEVEPHDPGGCWVSPQNANSKGVLAGIWVGGGQGTPGEVSAGVSRSGVVGERNRVGSRGGSIQPQTGTPVA